MILIYPGTFCPPTYGHVAIANKIAKEFGELIVICSINKDKNPMFDPKQCVDFFKSYNLEKNIHVETISDFRERQVDRSKIMMLRGIRNTTTDYQYEGKVLELNYKEMGIKNYMLIFSDEEYKGISSSKVRQAVKDLDFLTLSQSVSPLIITELLEKELNIRNLYIVTGRPATGKSEIVKELLDDKSARIDADALVKQLRPIVAKITGETDPVKMTDKYLEDKRKIDLALREPLLKLLKEELEKCRGKENVYIEVPYALREDNSTYKYLGGKIIYIYCDKEIIKQRIKERNKPHLEKFIEQIPSKEQAEIITKEKNLNIIFFDAKTRSAKENAELLKKELD